MKLVAALILTCELAFAIQTAPGRLSIAVVDFGVSPTSQASADRVITKLKNSDALEIVDRDGTQRAARGSGYAGSLNLSLREARDLGEAIGCDFYLIGDAQTLRRSRSDEPVYFESYASIFVVSTRSGRLVRWERLSFEGDSAKAAEEKLLAELSKDELSHRYLAAIQQAQEEEKEQRASAIESNTPLIEEAPNDEKVAAAGGLQLPRPYRRLRPIYPDSAARADAEAIVDVLVELDSAGEVGRTSIARWGGFGLDEASLNTARQLHFFPALRDGKPIPMRILLRYNFRKSAK
jgi:TonB family protein